MKTATAMNKGRYIPMRQSLTPPGGPREYNWYIWDSFIKDIIEGECCGPFFDKEEVIDAIRKLEN